MVGHWSCSLTTFIVVLPLLCGCGSSGNASKSNGMSADQLAKMMEADQAEAAKAAGIEVTAKELLKSLTADPSTAKPFKEAIAGRRRIIKGDVLERSPEEGETCYLTMDGGTQNGKAYKVKFNFGKEQQPEIASFKVGDTVQILGVTEGEVKDDTVAFDECSIYREGVKPNGGMPAPLALPKQK
jgi:hypothetical protein